MSMPRRNMSPAWLALASIQSARSTAPVAGGRAQRRPCRRCPTPRTAAASDSFGTNDGLVGVTLKPSRPRLPVRQPAVFITNRHLDLRQTLFVEYLVLRDHLVHEEQVGRQRIDLIGGESPLSPERHTAID